MKKNVREQRLAMVRRFANSELSRAEFCKQEGISISCFDYWRARAHQREALSGFVQVKVEEAQAVERAERMPRPSLEVELPMGVKLRFFESGR
jgi:hypothetical protein